MCVYRCVRTYIHIHTHTHQLGEEDETLGREALVGGDARAEPRFCRGFRRARFLG